MNNTLKWVSKFVIAFIVAAIIIAVFYMVNKSTHVDKPLTQVTTLLEKGVSLETNGLGEWRWVKGDRHSCAHKTRQEAIDHYWWCKKQIEDYKKQNEWKKAP